MSLFEELSKEDGIQRDTLEAFGQKIYLRSMNGDEIIDYSNGEDDPTTKKVAGLRLLVATMAEGSEDGPRIPPEDQLKFVELLRKKDYRQLHLLTKRARQLNGMSAGSTTTVQAVTKNA